MMCYRSLVRDRDGLEVQIGDVVNFLSGEGDQPYLGEIRYICARLRHKSPPIVFASWCVMVFPAV